ncbi:MAG: hypothetical protein E7Z70_01775 [Thermoplasmata archaeon]|nr:hypothetical protein [Thermoplasmata archaeon]
MIHCERCGTLKEDVLIGGGMIPPENLRQEIMEGRFGLDAKEIMLEHPDWPYYVDHLPFSCSCNYKTSFPVVVFFTDDGKEIRCDRHRCSKCGKVMRADSWGEPICWKCGGHVTIIPTMLWD